MAIIVIDAGHGGTRTVGGSSPNNATGPNGLLEKTATLQVARAVERALAGSGHTVIQTRTTDVNVGIDDRAAKARQNRAEVFVSIHFNAPGGNQPAQGTETWIGVQHTALSKKLAVQVQRHVVGATGHHDRGVKVGPVSGVISQSRHLPQTANCLVEISFLSLQPAEEARLRTAEYIQKLGEAVAAGIRAALAERGLEAGVESAWDDNEQEFEDASAFYAINPTQAGDASAVPERSDAERGAVITLARKVAAGAETAAVPQSLDIPFIVPYGTIDRPFDDLNGENPVDDPDKMLKGWREPEKAVGRYLTASAVLLGILSNARRAVAKIAASGQGHDGDIGQWVGTGFLVGENLLLTNHHVLNSPEVAAAASVEFDFEVSADALRAGNTAIAPSRKLFRLDPSRLFITSPFDDGLDYTFVWIDQAASKEFGHIPMERASFTVRPDEQAYIIHHPNGRPKEASLDDTDIVSIDSRVIHYSSDTLGGSSGSPVFNRQGRLIALHHASLPKAVQLPDGQTTNVINEGIKIAAIAIDLETRIRGASAEAGMAKEVLAAMKGSDTLTGFFGGLGREVAGDTAAEKVVNTYRSDAADIDIGCWNLEHLLSQGQEEEKVNHVAKALADLKLDLWGLLKVSRSVVEELRQALKNRFGEHYDFAMADPKAGADQPSNAVIWRTSRISGERVAWPADVERLLHLDSRDMQSAAAENLQGPVFDLLPSLFKFTGVGRNAGFSFNLVPLYMQALADGSLRKRLASAILRRALTGLVGERGGDIILGGNIGAPLLQDDFEKLSAAEATVLGARGEEGSFTYLRGENSFIDSVYVGPNLDRTFGATEYVRVARSRGAEQAVKTITDYKTISNYEPVMMRLCLGKNAAGQGQAERSIDIETLLDGVQRSSHGRVAKTAENGGKRRRPVRVA